MISTHNSYEEFTQEIIRIDNAKKDYIIGAEDFWMQDGRVAVRVAQSDIEPLDVKSFAHSQIAEKMGIPKTYYDKMAMEMPRLRDLNVNAWWKKQTEDGSRYMARTLDGSLRALLSDSYKPIDNHAVLASFIDAVKASGVPSPTIRSQSLTETNMYLQVVFYDLKKDVAPGEPVALGLSLRNSEVGKSAVGIELFLEVLKCSNGMVGRNVMRQIHLGRRIDNGAGVIFSMEAIEADVYATKLAMRDAMKSIIRADTITTEVNRILAAREKKIKPTKFDEFIDSIKDKIILKESEKDIVMELLNREGDFSVWGLSSAITDGLKLLDSRDRQYELERAGYDLLGITVPEKFAA